ncbi:hypothetical protein [Polaribacter sp. Hel_I_88]|uniref:hypothetical protein n=1 Tax=Polaribacter sp. Hel_I_88 TaxID=1250006 RepID=UPI00047DEFC4|nr:hypothetical protein [Polaribacter sp. Hel_I_88]
MKIIKKITAIIAITSLLIVSCNTKEKEYNLTLNDGTEVFYISNDESAISINGWSEFNTINKSLLNLKGKEYNSTIQSLEDLNGSITNLVNTVPASLKTEEVLEDIRDIQEEYTKLINEKNAPLKNVKQNIEELVEKFDDLREELNETVEDYIK